jgi:hypothetical protein
MYAMMGAHDGLLTSAPAPTPTLEPLGTYNPEPTPSLIAPAPPTASPLEIRPAAVVEADSARRVSDAIGASDVRNGGLWHVGVSAWTRYDRPWTTPDAPGDAVLVGAIHVLYGTPGIYDVMLFRATVTPQAHAVGWIPEMLCDEALATVGQSLATCVKAQLGNTPKPIRF